jgi:hypothetical protein
MPSVEFYLLDGTAGHELPLPEPPFQKSGFICWSYDSTGTMQTTLIKMVSTTRGYRMGERMRAVLPKSVGNIDLRLLAMDRCWIQGLDIDMIAIGNAVVVEADPDNVQSVNLKPPDPADPTAPKLENLRAFEITCASEALVVEVDW